MSVTEDTCEKNGIQRHIWLIERNKFAMPDLTKSIEQQDLCILG
jgi:hypothetical protein